MTLRQRIGGFFNSFKRGDSVSDANHWLLNVINRTTASSGADVNSDSALKVSAVYACVSLISDSIASLPLMLYRRDGEGKKLATDHPLYFMMHDAPNEMQTSFEFRECLMPYMLLRGNSYNLKVGRSKSEQIDEIKPLNPAGMEMDNDKRGDLIYRYTHEDGYQETFPAEKIWHVRHMPISASYNGNKPVGYMGVSPIAASRESIGIAMSADAYSGRFLNNNAVVGLSVTFPENVKISDDQKKILYEKLASYSIEKNKFKSLVMDRGGKVEEIGISNRDSQLIESRNYQVEEIARIYRVPSVLIGHPSNTMTYASAEQLFLSFATYTIRPWCVRLEQSMNRHLLPERDRGEYFFEFKMDGLLRGDFKTRMEGYSIARQWGLKNADECRALENDNPIPDGKGKIYLQPLNFTEAGTPPPVQNNQQTKQKGGDDNA